MFLVQQTATGSGNRDTGMHLLNRYGALAVLVPDSCSAALPLQRPKSLPSYNSPVSNALSY